jgi:hypothetical protein
MNENPLNDTVKIDVTYPSKNNNGQDDIRRYSTYYNIKLIEYPFITQFQDDNSFSLYSLFYNNFGKLSQNTDAIYWSNFFDISGTGLWEEYNGRLISTLFVGDNKIILNAHISQGLQNISLFELLRDKLIYDQMIVLNDNTKFL